MAEPLVPRPKFVAPEEGSTVWLVGDTYTSILTGADTGGPFSLSEAIVPAGRGPPPHIHLAEDETFIVLDGHIRLVAGDLETEAKPGSVLYILKGVRHSFVNMGNVPAKNALSILTSRDGSHVL